MKWASSTEHLKTRGRFWAILALLIGVILHPARAGHQNLGLEAPIRGPDNFLHVAQVNKSGPLVGTKTAGNSAECCVVRGEFGVLGIRSDPEGTFEWTYRFRSPHEISLLGGNWSVPAPAEFASIHMAPNTLGDTQITTRDRDQSSVQSRGRLSSRKQQKKAASTLSQPALDLAADIQQTPDLKLRGTRPYQLFGTMAVSMPNMPLFNSATKIISNRFHSGTGICIAVEEMGCLPEVQQEWRDILLAAGELIDRRERITFVNDKINSLIRYQDDIANGDYTDEWADPIEVMTKRRGDCEDYALLKMWFLVQLGFNARDMFVVVVDPADSKKHHAVLVLRYGDNWLVLDNRHRRVKHDHELTDYRAIASINAFGSWIHSKPIRRAADKKYRRRLMIATQ